MRVGKADRVPPDEREALLDLWVAAWTGAMPSIDFAARRAWFSGRIDEHLRDGARLLTLRPDEGEPLLGFALVAPATGYLDQLAVDPAHGGRGLASVLVSEAKRLCPAGLHLHVNQDNARAVRLYERHGFAKVGEGLNPRSKRPIWDMRWRPCPPSPGEATMVKATWNGAVIAQSDDTVVVERNHYFPIDAINKDALKPSSTTSVCPWKGTAGYYTVVANGSENPDAAWFYAEPKPAAAEIEGRVAFWKGVTVG